MSEENVFESTILRFGPIFFPQLIEVNSKGIEYTKIKFKNFLGVPIDIIAVDKKFINGVYISSHLLFGTTVTIENISGSVIVLKNFRRRDAREIRSLIFTV